MVARYRGLKNLEKEEWEGSKIAGKCLVLSEWMMSLIYHSRMLSKFTIANVCWQFCNDLTFIAYWRRSPNWLVFTVHFPLFCPGRSFLIPSMDWQWIGNDTCRGCVSNKSILFSIRSMTNLSDLIRFNHVIENHVHIQVRTYILYW